MQQSVACGWVNSVSLHPLPVTQALHPGVPSLCPLCACPTCLQTLQDKLGTEGQQRSAEEARLQGTISSLRYVCAHPGRQGRDRRQRLLLRHWSSVTSLNHFSHPIVDPPASQEGLGRPPPGPPPPPP